MRSTRSGGWSGPRRLDSAQNGNETGGPLTRIRGLMSIKNALASVAVRDLNAAMEWYARVLGKPPDSRPMPEVAEWQFDRGGWLQVYQLPERAGSGSFTLAVSNIGEHVAQLTDLGVDTGQQSSGDKVKTLMIADPDGNHIAFAEAIETSMAR